MLGSVWDWGEISKAWRAWFELWDTRFDSISLRDPEHWLRISCQPLSVTKNKIESYSYLYTIQIHILLNFPLNITYHLLFFISLFIYLYLNIHPFLFLLPWQESHILSCFSCIPGYGTCLCYIGECMWYLLGGIGNNKW